jgi:hypothetical protein
MRGKRGELIEWAGIFMVQGGWAAKIIGQAANFVKICRIKPEEARTST